MEAVTNLPDDKSTGYSLVESILSDDGNAVYLYALASGGGPLNKDVVYEKWEFIQTAPELVRRTVSHISTAGCETRLLHAIVEDSNKPKLQLVPSKPISAPPNLSDLLHSVQLKHQGLLGFRPGPEAQDGWSKLFAEYWGCVSRRDDFLILCRRKRLLACSDDDSVAKRRRDLGERVARRMARGRPKKTYDDQLDFDEMSGSGHSSQANDFDSMSQSAASSGGMSSFASKNSESPQPESEQASDQEDTQSLSRIGSTASGNSDICGKASSSFGSIASSSFSSSSSSGWSINSNERMRTRDFLTHSGNSWHYREIIEQHQSKECDVCHQTMLRWLHCFDCLSSDYDVCLRCIDKGHWCLYKSHEMLEADGDGPIIMRRFSDWAFTNELRVYDLNENGNQNCILEFSAEREDLLHESQPALHPSAPIFAWPLSPTKLLLASFKGEKERVIQRIRPFSKHGRKIDVQVQFSDSGSHLFVASIEAVKIRGQKQEEIYNLHMQVAVLQLCLEGESLAEPVALCERHQDLRLDFPLVSESLPFTWTWTPKEVYLTVVTDHIRLWRVRFNRSGPGVLSLGLLEGSIAQRPSQHQDEPFRAHVICSNEADVPAVALAPAHLRTQFEAPSIHYIEADSPWSACNIENDARHANAEVHPTKLFQGLRSSQDRRRAYLESADAPMSISPTQVSPIRSEIRLLCLLPGSNEDALRCRLTKVALDDLEDSKSKLMKRFARKDDENEPGSSHAGASKKKKPDHLGLDAETRILTQVDYSKMENANVTLLEMMSRAVKQSDTLPEKLKSISFRGVTGNTRALVAGFMEERKQDRTRTWKNWLHPKYNYEALSYVWGESLGNHTITLDGNKGVPVTDNLYAALRRLRHPDRQRVLWIDALCIDQNNLEERSWQVQMMGRIYSTAARVVIWLGDGEVQPSEAIPDHQSSDGEEMESNDGASSSSDSTKPESVSQWQKDTLTQVLKSASPRWWTRAWVTQELVLAEDVHVAFGPVEVNWAAFHSGLWSVWSFLSELDQLIELRKNRRTWHYKGSIGETALLARHTEATEDKDKVYSLLSLIKPGQETLIKPDYSLDTAEVFIQATYADLYDNVYGADIYKESPETFDKMDHFRPDVPKYPASSSSQKLVQTGLRPDRFRILNWAKTPHRLPGMPSWALDFSDPTALTGDAEFRYGFERWTFDGNNDLNDRALLKLSEDGRQLTVRGAILGRINNMVQEYPVHDYRNKPADEVVSRLLKLIGKLPSANPYEVASGSHAKLRTDDLRAIRRPNWIVREPITEPGEIIIEHEEVVTQILPHWDPKAEHGTVDWTDLYSIALNRGNCKVQGCRCGVSQFFRSWDTCVGVPHHARNISDYDGKKTSPWDEYCEHMKDDDPVKFRDPLQEEQSRFLLTTSSGFIGLGPESAGVGDVIALFYGSDIPVVLRSEGDHFVYRGRAWINGIMQGELWNIYEDPLLEEQDFVIS